MGEIIIRRFRHIAIDGVPGLGKTKFAEFLARKIEYLFIGEPVGENPFLNRFYDAKERYAFQTELFFLINRLRLHRKLMYPVLFNGVVTDFTLVRSQIYASINLNEFEYKLYKDFLNELKKGIDEPEAVFFFYALPEYVYYVLKKRGVKNLPENYIENLTELFCEYYYNEYKGALLIVDVESVRIESDEKEAERIIELMPEKGVMYYSGRKTFI